MKNSVIINETPAVSSGLAFLTNMEITHMASNDNIKLIPLTQGYSSIVDTEDYDLLIKHKWCVNINKNHKIKYAQSIIRDKFMSMHRLIMNPPKSILVDHINGNGLDNRKCNLRLCSSMENQRNAKIRKNKISKYKGVDWHVCSNKWRARITINKKLIEIGYYKNEKEAAKAYDTASIKYFASFAKGNFL